MKKFLFTILVFISPLILFIPIDYAFSHLLKQSNKLVGEFEVWNDIFNSNAKCDIAIYGSSRACFHIDPEIIGKRLNTSVYNFGIDGGHFWLQYLRHLEFLKYNNKPRQIILSVDVFSLGKRSELFASDQFLPFMLWNSNIEEYTNSYIGYNRSDYYIPLIRYFGKYGALRNSLQILVNGAPLKSRQNGYKGRNKEWNSDLEKAKAKRSKYEAKYDKKSIELFEKFINECKDKNIDLVLVYTPEYIEGQSYVSNRSEVIKIYRDFANKCQIAFLDYSNHKICRNKSLFYNSLHLNKNGAEIFSEKLADDLMALTYDNISN